MTRRSKDFDRFDRVMDGLLAVPKEELQKEIDREKKAERLDADVRSGEGALQETPEMLDPVRVDVAIHVPFGMVNDLVLEVRSKVSL